MMRRATVALLLVLGLVLGQYAGACGNMPGNPAYAHHDGSLAELSFATHGLPSDDHDGAVEHDCTRSLCAPVFVLTRNAPEAVRFQIHARRISPVDDANRGSVALRMEPPVPRHSV